MAQQDLAGACGTYCGTCHFFKTRCGGCVTLRGKPFWIKEYKRDICRLYDCAVNHKRLLHCGECVELPCKLFIESSDPSLTPEQAQANREARILELKTRKAIGTGAWLQQKQAAG